MKEVIIAAVQFVREFYKGKEYDGNNYYHAERVYYIALELVKTEKANNFLVALASLLHSVDTKEDRNAKRCPNARKFLATQHLESKIIESVVDIISQVDFKYNRTHARLRSPEANVVADANMLDAIGAVGIARCFAYGGAHGMEIYDGTITTPNSIKSFYDKLLVIKDCLHTDTAKKIAEERSKFMDQFIAEFYKEWNVGRSKTSAGAQK